MTDKVDLADGTPVIRKVQWSTVGASVAGTIGMQVAPILSDALAYALASSFSFWASDTAFLALSFLIEAAIVGLFAGGGALGGGYYARSRPSDLIAKETQR